MNIYDFPDRPDMCPPEPKLIPCGLHCRNCNEPIMVDDEYVEMDDLILCADCYYDNVSKDELLGMAGVTLNKRIAEREDF